MISEIRRIERDKEERSIAFKVSIIVLQSSNEAPFDRSIFSTKISFVQIHLGEEQSFDQQGIF
jgi:phosphoribosylanthranilate isomerase